MLAVSVAGLVAVQATGSRQQAASSSGPGLVKTMKASGFGHVLATPGDRALYYWTPEKRAPGRIRCTGSCAASWPPLIVRNGAKVPRRVTGLDGSFGTIRRPDGRAQLTYDRLPLYTYAHEAPRQVLCNNVDGWFVVKP
jgi:predicted lipoprotein with Yx(FWY)xxD motif